MLQSYAINHNLISSDTRPISGENPAELCGEQTSDEERRIVEAFTSNGALHSGPQWGGLALPPSGRLVAFCESVP